MYSDGEREREREKNIYIYIYILYTFIIGNYSDLTADLTGIMLGKGNHPQMA